MARVEEGRVVASAAVMRRVRGRRRVGGLGLGLGLVLRLGLRLGRRRASKIFLRVSSSVPGGAPPTKSLFSGLGCATGPPAAGTGPPAI